jgi:hypothetical protein
MKYISTHIIQIEIEHNQKRAIAKREVRRRHKDRWNYSVTQLETDTTNLTPKPLNSKEIK